MGHKVNEKKTTIYFSNNTDVVVVATICNILRFFRLDDLGSYLVLLLLHKSVTKCTFNFVMDKVCYKLGNWNAKSLSLAGRITLARSVMLSIPNYFMRTVKIPLGICDEIE